MGEDTTESPSVLIPKHESTPYLTKIKGLEPTDLQLIITSANNTNDEIVASALVNASIVRKFTLDPDYFLKDVQGIQAYSLRNYDRFQEKLAEAGKTRDTLTEEDITWGDPILSVAKLSREEYLAYLEAQIQKETEHVEEHTRRDLNKALTELKEALPPLEFQRMLGFLGVTFDDDQIAIVETDSREMEEKALFLARVGKNLSKKWRNQVALSPWQDPELAQEMRKQGEEIKADEYNEAIALTLNMNSFIARIEAGELTKEQIIEGGEYFLNQYLANGREIDTFLENRIRSLLGEDEIHPEQVAFLLKAL